MSERKGNINFVLIGARTAGKTWYIAYLNTRNYIKIHDDETANYIKKIKNNLDKATGSYYQKLYFNYTKDPYDIKFQIDDYDGGSAETLSDSAKNRENKERLTKYIEESEGIFVFLPYEKDVDDDPDEKFKNIRDQIEPFINRAEKEKKKKDGKIPIPLIIVVSKWDDSSFYKDKEKKEDKEYQDKKAKEYIEEHKVLRDIKNKLEDYFKKNKIIPLSSTKGYNATLPIKMALDSTFKRWEEEIEELKGNAKNQLIYLSTIYYDIRFFEEGKYKELFNNLNEEIAPPYIEELPKLKSIKDFDDFYNRAHKDEKDRNILDAFSEKYKKQINNTRDELEKKKEDLIREEKKKKKDLMWKRIAIAIIVLAAIALGYSKYKLNKGEERLFHNIQTEFENKNYSAVLSDIKIYNVEYNSVNEKHLNAVKLLEEQSKAKYRVEIDRVLAKLPEIKSVAKACGTIGEINIKAKEYGVPPDTLSLIQKKFFRLDEINGAYNKANEEMDKLSLGSISKEKIDDIAGNKSKLVGFTEYQILEKKFDAKIQTILNASLESDDENRLELMLDIASSIEIADDKIAALKARLHKIKVNMQFNELVEQLKRIDTIADLTNKISTDWSAEYDDKKKQIEIRNLVETKYNEWVKKQLKREAPQSINSIDDYSRLDIFAREGINMQQRIEGLPVKISISKSVGNKKVYDEKLKLFQRYKEIFDNGIATTSLALHIPKNNSLDITSFDDKVSIFLNGQRAYRHSDSNGFRGNKIVFNHRYKYKAQRYSLKIKETDIVYDDYANENFTITDNKLIELENSGRLHIKLGNGYEIDIYK